jgi:hypothetical protein
MGKGMFTKQRLVRCVKGWRESPLTRFGLLITVFCFLDEHDGNVVPNFIKQFAMLADQAVFLIVKPNRPLAFRAGKDV